MKKLFLNTFKVLLFSLLISCTTTVFAQKTGGYKEVSVDDAGVKAAADYAIEAKSKEEEAELSLESIEKAETQTVAGINYRLCLVINKSEDETWYIKAVIYQNLQRQYKITSWEHDENSCGVE